VSRNRQAPAPHALVLELMTESLSIVRLKPDAPLPGWAGGTWWSMTRTPEELSVVCETGMVPPGVSCAGPWRALKVRGPLDFALTGVLDRIAGPLAAAGISLFAVSTYDTDYVLVRRERVDEAIACLREAGLVVQAPGSKASSTG